jgi:hypothetical protein
MILNIHSDASYLSEANAHSRACGHLFMGWKPDASNLIKLNGAFFTLCSILRFVVASAAEAELGALFLNCKQATIFWLTFKEMGHPQPPIPINCNNLTAVGIANNTIKRQRSRSMEMQFFWVADAVEQGKFDIKYFPSKENLADYQSKHMQTTKSFQAIHSERVCWNPARRVSYVRTYPLPQVPTKQSDPITGKRLPPYYEIPILIPTLRCLIGPTIAVGLRSLIPSYTW